MNIRLNYSKYIYLKEKKDSISLSRLIYIISKNLIKQYQIGYIPLSDLFYITSSICENSEDDNDWEQEFLKAIFIINKNGYSEISEKRTKPFTRSICLTILK